MRELTRNQRLARVIELRTAFIGAICIVNENYRPQSGYLMTATGIDTAMAALTKPQQETTQSSFLGFFYVINRVVIKP